MGRRVRLHPAALAAGAVLGMAGAEFALARVADVWFRLPGAASSLWWPAAGVALAILIRCPRSWWPALLVAVGVANIAGNRPVYSWSAALFFALANMAELATAGVLLTDRSDIAIRRLRTPGEAGRFALGVAVAVLGAGAIVALRCLAFGPVGSWWGVTSGYVVTHALGLIAVVPLLLPRPPRAERPASRPAEWALITAATLAFGAWNFLLPSTASHSFLCLLPLIWAGVRLDALRATACALLTAVLATVGTAHGRGVFAGAHGSTQQALSVQLFLATIMLSTLALVLVTGQRDRLAAEARESAQTLQTAIAGASIGICTVDLTPERFGTLRSANDALCRLVGYRPGDLVGQDVSIFGDPDDPSAPAAAHERVRAWAAATTGMSLHEGAYLTASGERLWLGLAVSTVRPRTSPPYLMIHVQDLTDREFSARQLERQALHDALTDLPNRVLLTDRIAHALRSTQRDDLGVGVLYLDMDGFKPINDRHGHAAGDAVLVEVARRLRAAVRPGDTVARLGGDEFAVVCPALGTVDDLDRILSRVRAALSYEVMLPDGFGVAVEASIGVSLSTPESTVEQMLLEADRSMYIAKRTRSALAQQPV